MEPLDPANTRLVTDRLVLRPTVGADARRAFEIQANWVVTSMLAGARFPPDREETERLFAQHQDEWRDGSAYRFAVEHEGRFIGVVDIERIREGRGSLGTGSSRRHGERALPLKPRDRSFNSGLESSGCKNSEQGMPWTILRLASY